MTINKTKLQKAITQLSKQSYAQLVELHSQENYNCTDSLNELIAQSRELYKQLAGDYAYITLDDFKSFEANYVLMLNIMKTLCRTYRKHDCYLQAKKLVAQLKRYVKLLDKMAYDIPTFNKDLSPKGKERRDSDLQEMKKNCS